MNVLLIEENAAQLKLRRHMFTRRGHNIVFPAADALVGIEAMKRRQDIEVVIAGKGVKEDPSGLDALAFAKRFIPSATTILVLPFEDEAVHHTAKILGIDQIVTEKELESKLVEMDLIPATNRLAKAGEMIIKS